MEGAKYRAILQENLLESTKDLRLGGGWPSSRTKKLNIKPTDWLKTRPILKCQNGSVKAQNYVNPIKNLWQDLNTAIHKGSPFNLTEFELFCKEERAMSL